MEQFRELGKGFFQTLKPVNVTEIIIQAGAKTNPNNIVHYCAFLDGIFEQHVNSESAKEIVSALDLNILSGFTEYA